MNPEDLSKIADIVPEKSRNALFEAPLRSIGYAINGYLHWKFGPLIQIGAVSDASIKSLSQSIEEKTKGLEESDFDRKKLGLAIKSMDEVGYQIDNETLREMFANLISKSINKNKSKDSSPLMVSALTSISPESAEFLKSWHTEFPEGVSTLNTIVTQQIQDDKPLGSSPIIQNIVIFKDLSVHHDEYIIDELRQVGIFELHMDGNLTDPRWIPHYDVVEKIASTQFPELQNDHQKTVANKGFIRLSPFGISFINLVLD